MRRLTLTLCAWLAVSHTTWADAVDPQLRDQATAALKKAATYYYERVAVHGGYVYHYSPDLTRRWGEGEATAEQIWVQPPGTPTVGLALLEAYKTTGDKDYLEAARAAGQALVYGRLKSGGWTNSVDFDTTSNRRGNYLHGKGSKKGTNNSTLDDDITQSAIRFLAHLDKSLEFKDAAIHEAAQTALEALLKAQFPNGAFPQTWTGPVASQPIVKPSYPDYDWRTEGRIKNYWDMYNLNDGIAGYVTSALLDAANIYQDDRYKQAALKLGDFLILAQMPEPQPAWCQQYGYDMRPIWARKFEPPAVTGGESQDVMNTLITLYAVSGDDKYLAPIPAALAYLKKSKLPDGRLARYYELQTNKPLYMERKGEVYSPTYDDSNLPDHYGWKIDSRLDGIEESYSSYKHGPTGAVSSFQAIPPEMETEARRLIAELDDQGRWLSTYDGERIVGQAKMKPGEQYISSAVFSDNVTSLCRYLRVAKQVAGAAK